jgi:hypothetical protein
MQYWNSFSAFLEKCTTPLNINNEVQFGYNRETGRLPDVGSHENESIFCHAKGEQGLLFVTTKLGTGAMHK